MQFFTISGIYRLILLPLLLATLLGCGYSLSTARNSGLNASKTVWVPFFDNSSVSPTAQTVLKRVFHEELHALRGLLPASNINSADIVIKAKILTYDSKVVSYTAADKARQLSLALSVDLEASRKGETLPFWRGQLQGVKQYPSNSNLALQANAEEKALESAARNIAGKLVSAMEENY